MATVSLVIRGARNGTDKLPRICDYYIFPCNTAFTLVQWHISVNSSCTLKVAFSLTNWYIYWSSPFFVGLWTEQQSEVQKYSMKTLLLFDFGSAGLR